jgi:hypothetical protein
VLVGLGFMICEGWIVSEDQRLGVIGRGLCCLGFWNLGFIFFWVWENTGLCGLGVFFFCLVFDFLCVVCYSCLASEFFWHREKFVYHFA